MGGRTRRTAGIADGLHSAAIHLLRALRREDERAGVGTARLSALSVLVFAGPMRLTDLARLEQVKPPTMTKLIAGLEADGLVRRRVVSDDARAWRMEATPRGSRVLQRARGRRVSRLSTALEGLSQRDRELLSRAAEIIEAVARTL